jgi:hypothetical protein
VLSGLRSIVVRVRIHTSKILISSGQGDVTALVRCREFLTGGKKHAPAVTMLQVRDSSQKGED